MKNKKIFKFQSLLLFITLAFLLALLPSAWSEQLVKKPSFDQDGRFFLYRENTDFLPFIPHGVMPEEAAREPVMITFDLGSNSNPHSGATCWEVTIPQWKYPWWTGVACITKDKWWGEDDSGTVYNLSNVNALEWYMRGKEGGERVQVKVGILGDKPFGDSTGWPIESPWLTLTPDWKLYKLSLEGYDLSRIANGFTFVLSKDRQSNEATPLTFFIDDIAFVRATTNIPPVWTAGKPPEQVTVEEGGSMEIPIEATDADADALTYSKNSGPDWAVVNSSTQMLKLSPPVGIIPENATDKDFIVELVVTDGQTSLPKTLTVTVTRVQRRTLAVAKVTAPVGGEVKVAVQLSNADDLTSFDLVMDFNPTKLEFVSPPSLDIVKGFTVEANVIDGRLKVFGFAEKPLRDPNKTGGILMTLSFKILPAAKAGEEIPLQLTPEVQLYDNANNVIPLHLQSGSIIIQDCLLGDINDDGFVKSADALMALQIAVGKREPTPKQLCAADVNKDGRVTAVDARMILLRAIEKLTFAPPYTMQKTPSLQWHVAYQGGRTSIRLVAVGLVAGDARIAGIAESTYIRKGDGILEHQLYNGELVFAWADTKDGSTPRTVLSIDFPSFSDIRAINSFGKSIHLEGAVFYTPDGRAFHPQVPSFTLESLYVPAKSRLLPNYPNPFNPETWLPFELAESSAVSIHIYDVQGRLVRTLSLGMRDPGAYYSRGRAAYWDGRNNAGELVASGLYYVELRTEHTRYIQLAVVQK